MVKTENGYNSTDLGNITFNPRGEYSKDTTYEYLDTVSYRGGSYMCLVDLGDTITGIEPTEGKNTKYWQLVATPGDITERYTKMYEDVVTKSGQVEVSRAAVSESQHQVEMAEADVKQMRQDTLNAAETAISSASSASESAQSAEASKTAAKESEDNVNALATTFDSHVNEKISEAEKEINNTKQNAVDAVSESLNAAVTKIENETNKQVKSVENAGASQVSAVNKAGKSRVDEISTAGSTMIDAVEIQQKKSVQAVTDEGTKQIKAVSDKATEQISAVNKVGSTQISTIESKGSEQVKAVQNAGENALQNISNGVDKGLSEEGKAADAKATGEAISKLTEDLSNKITKFYASNQSETHLADSDNGKIQDMMIYGKSSQDGTPTPENPVEIKSVVNPTIKICGKNLFDSKKFPIILNRGIDTNTGAIYESTSGNYCATEKYIPFPHSGKKISFNASMSLCAYDQDYKFISSVNKYNGQVPSGTIYVRFDIKIEDKDKVQIELSENTTTYEPYKEQTIQLPITLNAIPVSSGGNVTINGQQYIADYVDVERGKLVKRVYEYVFSGEGRWNAAADGAQYLAWRVGDNPGIIDSTYDKKCLCSCLIANIMNTTRKGENYISTQSFDDTYRIWVSANVATSKLTGEKVFLALIVPEEISLTQEEIRAFKELAAYYPVTNVNVASEQLNGYTVFNYPVSMKNGWNYVKQQLNDNRDYIYDMDLQSAEAYVNSEYAVALTELEV